jgi:hypothetical protein
VYPIRERTVAWIAAWYRRAVPRARSEIVADLERRGLRFRTFTLEAASPDAIEDVMWNEHDLPHVPFVHRDFRMVLGEVSDGALSGYYLQRVLGVTLPMPVSYRRLGPGRRVYETALGPVVLIVESELTARPSGTHERTTYSVGAPRWATAVLAVAERVLRRNAARLRAEDAPLRARRTELRRRGYRFAEDSQGPSYQRSMDLSRRSVLPPPLRADEVSVDLDDGRREWWLGSDDHLGLRVVREGAQVTVFPRLCAHQGASLDACELEHGGLRCPWHGRSIGPLARFELGRPNPQVRSGGLVLDLSGSRLRVAPLEAPSVSITSTACQIAPG